mmetsp:Transcript_14683/g.37152  ORF Transcript_14683/g.37152 Transcript_14683/m.37152 type:complete len:99 (+) Transcript_14683:206-502(+)
MGWGLGTGIGSWYIPADSAFTQLQDGNKNKKAAKKTAVPTMKKQKKKQKERKDEKPALPEAPAGDGDKTNWMSRLLEKYIEDGLAASSNSKGDGKGKL